MQPLKEVVREMEILLDRLIENAKRLLELSKQVIVEDEVVALQKVQDDMVTQLTDLDGKRAALCASFESSEMPNQGRIDEKIDVFQNLNTQFIENLSAMRGLIHFEGDKIVKKGKTPKKPE